MDFWVITCLSGGIEGGGGKRLKNFTSDKGGLLEYYRASRGRSRKSYCGKAKILFPIPPPPTIRDKY